MTSIAYCLEEMPRPLCKELESNHSLSGEDGMSIHGVQGTEISGQSTQEKATQRNPHICRDSLLVFRFLISTSIKETTKDQGKNYWKELEGNNTRHSY